MQDNFIVKMNRLANDSRVVLQRGEYFRFQFDKSPYVVKSHHDIIKSFVLDWSKSTARWQTLFLALLRRRNPPANMRQIKQEAM